ncbi:helix-turn-helix transcriptional regulator [Kineosporia sp. J2-2]|uniref:Helix-turn-helix transcriptional regulator n=1 Tax=Kineosporia corallincola TaxID=2835133 RepID=A0ABS5TGY0_9ACTN|nr:helix-turn-helix domain-containing protein [Kineosporia corallincola]MBT0770327.1 helix-turn-helix transcriptional regulator [Kineosporia corallincola]
MTAAPRTGGGRRPPQHVHPRDVSIETALAALADPVRLSIVRCVAQAGDWELPCGSFAVGVGKATLSHHFTVLREAGLVEQRDEGARRTIRLRRAEFDERFPGLLGLVLLPSAETGDVVAG